MKNNPNREKNQISTVETEISTSEKKAKKVPVKKKVGVKKLQKVDVKRFFSILPVKKPSKSAKNCFHGHF